MKVISNKSSLFWQNRIHVVFYALFTVLLILFNEAARADGYSLIVNGKSIHKEAPKKGSFNEKNWGFGLQYDYKLYNDRWQPYLTTSIFKDSYKRNSFYAGGGIMRRFSLSNLHDDLYFGAGAVAFVMTRKDHHDRRPFLGALPAFTIGTNKVAVNISYVPKVEPKLIPLWFIQLKVSFENFD